MDNKEAIEYLNDVRNGIHIPAPGIELPLLNDKEKEAVDLAISALEKQEESTMNQANQSEELISRQAAIDALTKDYYYHDEDYMTAISVINALPSAQPEYEELTPEEAASEIASGSTMSAWYWLDDMIRLKQMGYAICRKTRLE